MRSNLIAALALCVLAVPACKKNEAQPEAAVTPPPAAVEPAPAPTPPPAPEPAPVDPAVAQLAACPTTVTGAETNVKASKKDVVVTIAAKDAAAAKEIQTRAHALAAADGTPNACPVIIATTDATAKLDDTKDGVKFTFTPVAPKKADEIAPSINERLAAAPKADAAAPADGAAPAAPADGAAPAAAKPVEGAAPADHAAHGAHGAPTGGAAAPSGEGAAKAATEDKAEAGKK